MRETRETARCDAGVTPALRSRQGGFTMVELLAYLVIFVALTGALMGAEVAARRMNRNEGVHLEALGQADRAFSLLSLDCDRAVGLAIGDVKGRKELILLGPDAVKWIAKDGELLRGTSLIGTFIEEVAFERPDAAKHPRLLTVRLTFARRLVGKDEFRRTYERSFLIRNLDGDGRGGL